MKRILMTLALFVIACATLAENTTQLLREGNRLFKKGNYVEAEAKYRKVLEAEPNEYRALYNLGNTLYKQDLFAEAAEKYKKFIDQAPSDDARAAGWHNLGNSLLENKDIVNSIEAYKESLRLAPMNEDTRYNLAYAFNLLEEQPPQPQDESCDGDGEGDEKQEQPQNDENGDNKQDGESAPDEDQQDGEQDRSTGQRPEKLSPEEAERILEALRQQEQKVQKEINRDQSAEPIRREREW